MVRVTWEEERGSEEESIPVRVTVWSNTLFHIPVVGFTSTAPGALRGEFGIIAGRNGNNGRFFPVACNRTSQGEAYLDNGMVLESE